MDIKKDRREYHGDSLPFKDLPSNPFDLFSLWLDYAIESNISDPTAMVLATSSLDHTPSQRIVLLKEIDNQGFVFYTNLKSHKAKIMAENSKVNLLFPWNELNKQVQINGIVESVETEKAKAYFKSRPIESQIAAIVSYQSQKIRSREELVEKYKTLESQVKMGDELKMPDYWGGYRVIPTKFEFWIGREYRLHDRFIYENIGDNRWEKYALSP